MIEEITIPEQARRLLKAAKTLTLLDLQTGGAQSLQFLNHDRGIRQA